MASAGDIPRTLDTEGHLPPEYVSLPEVEFRPPRLAKWSPNSGVPSRELAIIGVIDLFMMHSMLKNSRTMR